MFVLDLRNLITIVRDICASIRQRRVDTNNALGIINAACIDTEIYLNNADGIYGPSQQLAHAWSNAATAVRLIDGRLSDMLLSKSRFWTNPQNYFDENLQGNIATLMDLRDEFEVFRNENRV